MTKYLPSIKALRAATATFAARNASMEDRYIVEPWRFSDLYNGFRVVDRKTGRVKGETCSHRLRDGVHARALCVLQCRALNRAHERGEPDPPSPWR